MKVAKAWIVLPKTSAHLLCVPGRTTTRGAACAHVSSSSAPRICVSSPRITSGTPSASRQTSPGTSQRRVPGTGVNAAAKPSKSAGQSRYGASIQPCLLPIRPPFGLRRVRMNSHLPARRRVVVARARFDPALAGGRLLLLPERSARLQVIHDEFARGERLAAVRAGHDDQHDLIGGLQLADAMDHERIVDAPSRLGLVDDPRERLLGHARIMFERERGYGRCVVDVADETDKRGDRAYARVAGA